MDDFRKRYDVPRRDYNSPPQGQPSQPAQPPAPSVQIPINSEPPAQAVTTSTPPQYQPAHQNQSVFQEPAAEDTQASQYIPTEPVTYQQPTAAVPSSAYNEPSFHRPLPAQPEEAQVKKQSGFKLGLKPAIIGAAVLLVIIGGGFFAFKPSKTAAVKPADLAKKSTFDVYYPSKLPNGYIYREDLATYENGGAYYTFVKGPKHVVIRENVTSTGKLDTNEVTNPVPLETPAGKAVIGTNTGQTAAAVLAGQTYIFIYSNNSVPPEEITAIVQELKNIGHNK